MSVADFPGTATSADGSWHLVTGLLQSLLLFSFLMLLMGYNGNLIKNEPMALSNAAREYVPEPLIVVVSSCQKMQFLIGLLLLQKQTLNFGLFTYVVVVIGFN